MIRSDEVASSLPAKQRRARPTRRRGLSVGVASLAAVLGTALVPALGSTPAGATGTAVTVVTGHSGSTAPSLGIPAPEASAQISPTYVAYDPSNGDTAVAQTKAGSVFVYLIAGASESNEYNIQTAPSPSPAFGSLTAGDAYLVAGTGTAGLIAEPGNNQFGNSTTAVATSNPISPTSVAFDPNGNLLIAGEFGTDSAIQVVAKTTGTFYGVAMTAGDLYTIADVGVSGAPSSAINMGDVAAPSDGISVDPSGNIVVGDGDGVEFVNETSGSLTLYGQSIAAQSSTVIAGTAQGNTDCTAGATTESALAEYFQSPEPYIDSSDNVYLSDNETGPTSGCDWVLPAQSGTLDGMSVTAGNVYKLAGNGGTTSTPDGTAGVQSNVAGTSQMALDGAGNVVLALTGAATGTSPALRVLAESSATYYGVAMTAGDIYTVAGGSSNLLATLSHPTSLLNIGSGNLLFTDGSSSSANLDQFSGAPTGATPVPAVTGISPSSGPTAGGTSVTVSGTNLTGATAVHFGSTAGTGITSVTATSLTVTSPAGTGTVDVTVTTPNGTSAVNSPSDHFTYNAPALPTVTGISPSSGPTAGGTSVTVTGSNLTGATAVDFGSTPGTSITGVTAGSLTVTSPAGTGTVDVTVTTPNGTSAVNSPSDHFTYNAPALPTVTGVSPTNGPAAGGTSVTVTGSNLTGATAVDFGSTPGTGITGVSSGSLTVTAPAGTGTVNVTVTTPNGTSAINAPSDDYTYNAPPTVTSVSPNNGPQAGGNTVTVNGSGFSGIPTVDFGSIAGVGVTGVTSTSLTVTVPAGTGTVSVTVVTASGGASTPLANAYTYTALPTVTGISPSSGPTAGGTSVTVSGTNLTGATAVHFGSTAGTGITSVTATSLTVTSPAGTGTVDVTVTTPNGTSAINAPSDHFTYNAPALPTVTGIGPSSGPTAGGTSVTVSGTNLTGATAVHFGSTAGTGITSVTATSLTVTSPAGTGTVDVTVTTPNGTSAVNSPSDHFTYNAPATPENTATSLTVPTLTFGAEGAPTAFTGTVVGPASADGIPAGTVTVFDNFGVAGQTQLCQTTLSGGSGDSVNYSCSLASATQLAAGSYTNVVASYSGGSSSNTSFTYNASTSSPQTLTVSPASTTGNNLKIELSSPGLLWGIGGLYEVSITNEAATSTTGTLTVTDALPAGLSYLFAGSLPPGWHCSATSGTVTCTSSKAIAAHGVDRLFLVVRVSARPGTSMTDTVNLAPVGTPANNYTSSVTTRVQGLFHWGWHQSFPRHGRAGTPLPTRRWR